MGRLAKTFDLESFLSSVNGGRSQLQYQAGQAIFAQGDPCDAVFYMRAGQCKITVISEHGKEAIVAIQGDGDFFGEGCLTGLPLRLATATALSACDVMRISKAAMQGVLHREPSFAEFFMSYLLRRQMRVEADLVDQLFNSSEKRLARVLLLMANFGKDGKTELVIPKLSQETLAEMIGTTRSRVSGFMNKFRRLGFIEYNGELKVHNSLLNVILNNIPPDIRAVIEERDKSGRRVNS